MRRYMAVVLLVAAAAVAQVAPAEKGARKNEPQNPAPTAKPGAAQPGAPKTPEAIVSFLIPDNVAYPERLNEVPRVDAVDALTKAQAKDTGARTVAIAYLLVLLGQDADANRMRLTESLRRCNSDPDNCDERVVAYLGSLFEKGDKLVLDPLLDAGDKSQGDFADALGSTYDDIIARDPRTFITAVSRRSPKDQRKLCRMVAAGDGLGLPDDTSGEVQEALQKMAREVGPVASTAMMCVNEIRAAEKQ